MTKNKIKVLIISAFLVIVVCCAQMQQPGNNSNNTNNMTAVNVGTSPTPAACNASADWVSNPQNAPGEIPDNGPTLCQFHQFSWQWFLALMNAAGDSRVFQNEQNYPLLQAGGTNSCTATGVKTIIFVRTRKDDDNANDDFVLPEDIKQAGSDSVIYDRNGNVVYYEVRFSRDQCSLDPATAKMFPAGTTEIKVSYRVITAADKPNYVWINADINGDGTTGTEELLGMVGFHLVKSTPLHPEFVWATFEHKSNAPECQSPPDTTKTWSFTSAQCAAQLPNSVNQQQCNLNPTPTPTPTPPAPTPTPSILSGAPPTQICRVYHDGTKTGDNQYQSNISDIDMLNTQLTGPSGFITGLPDSNPLAVLKNYMLVGALWVTNPANPADLANQRGSIQLANSTMETTYQQAPNFQPQPYTGTSNLQPAANCFACHTYTPNNNIGLSHTFKKITGQQKTN